MLCYCSGCSGLVSASLGTPADVVKTRMMNQKYVNGRYNHVIGVITVTAKLQKSHEMVCVRMN